MRRIFLVRHGESEANVDKAILLRKPDHAIGLSEKGERQAVEAGRWLEDHLDRVITRAPNPRNGTERPKDLIRMWVSPYRRTRETGAGLMNVLGPSPDGRPPWCEVKEHVLLCEQQYGLFDGILDEDLPKRYPEEHAHYKKCEDFEGRFWARMPLGESRFDVVQRVHQSFGTFHRDNDRHGINNIIVVAHGVTIRAFVMMWTHKPVEWFEAEPNPRNCSIRLIENGEDAGYIFEGFKNRG